MDRSRWSAKFSERSHRIALAPSPPCPPPNKGEDDNNFQLIFDTASPVDLCRSTDVAIDLALLLEPSVRPDRRVASSSVRRFRRNRTGRPRACVNTTTCARSMRIRERYSGPATSTPCLSTETEGRHPRRSRHADEQRRTQDPAAAGDTVARRAGNERPGVPALRQFPMKRRQSVGAKHRCDAICDALKPTRRTKKERKKERKTRLSRRSQLSSKCMYECIPRVTEK